MIFTKVWNASCNAKIKIQNIKKMQGKLVDIINENLKVKGGLSGVEAVGGKNQPRPFNV